MFRGTFTALVTPFRNDTIDVAGFEKLVESQIAAGIDGIVAVGTTGESPTLSHREREEVIRLAVQIAKKRCRVLAGTGSNSTQHAVADTKLAERLGVDGALLVAPYYNKPSQEVLFRHFKPSPRRRHCPSCSTTFPADAASISDQTRSRAWQPNAAISFASRKPAAASSGSVNCARVCRRHSPF